MLYRDELIATICAVIKTINAKRVCYLYYLNKDRSSTCALNDIDNKASFVVSAYDSSRLASLFSAR
jgi:hypothetical protein